jgi:S-adenosylmethionine:tRNA ribosyltransferase-isomerase
MVSFRQNDRIVHARFRDLPQFLRSGDLMVLNDSATLAAALEARRFDGEVVAFHLSTHLPADLWIVEPRKIEAEAGESFDLPAGARARLLVPYPGSARLWVARLDLPQPMSEYLRRWGRPITYPYVRGSWPIDMYQTVYADEPGSAEMPSAGRPFTIEMLRRLGQAGVGLAFVTLHAGVASLERDEAPYEEWYHVPAATAGAVAAATQAGNRVIAVGTTVVRALESASDERGHVVASRGWTGLVITPDRRVRTIDGLLTGFHEPRASHLAILEAIAGRRHLEHAYQTALDARYLWHEFGDVHLIL